MTNKEIVERNIGLTFDFVNYLIDKPEKAVELPDKFKLEFIEKDFPKIERKLDKNSAPDKTRKIVIVRNSFEFTK